jgi:hypothetical protein
MEYHVFPRAESAIVTADDAPIRSPQNASVTVTAACIAIRSDKA